MKPPRLPLHVHVNRYESTIWHVLIAVACYWLMGAMLLGCGGAPESVSIDPTLTMAERAAIQDAIDQWCAADGWCPEVVFDGEAHIVVLTGAEYADRRRSPGSFAFTDESLGVIYINGAKRAAEPEMFWVALAHELGHLQGIEHHGLPGCTMNAVQTQAVYALACE